jgi:hypothetical protein
MCQLYTASLYSAGSYASFPFCLCIKRAVGHAVAYHHGMKRDTGVGERASWRGKVWSESLASLPWMLGAVVGGVVNSSQ